MKPLLNVKKDNVTFLIKHYITVPIVCIGLGLVTLAVTFYFSLFVNVASDYSGMGCGLSQDICGVAEPINPLISMGIGLSGLLIGFGIAWKSKIGDDIP